MIGIIAKFCGPAGLDSREGGWIFLPISGVFVSWLDITLSGLRVLNRFLNGVKMVSRKNRIGALRLGRHLSGFEI